MMSNGNGNKVLSSTFDDKNRSGGEASFNWAKDNLTEPRASCWVMKSSGNWISTSADGACLIWDWIWAGNRPNTTFKGNRKMPGAAVALSAASRAAAGA